MGNTHRYLESGLPNVLLRGIQVRRCEKCLGQDVAIPNIAGLHRRIAMMLVMRKSALAACELRFLREYLGQTSKGFAETLGVTPETMSRWEKSRRDIPPVVDRMVRLLAVNGPPRIEFAIDMLVKIRPVAPKNARIELRLRRHGWEPEKSA